LRRADPSRNLVLVVVVLDRGATGRWGMTEDDFLRAIQEKPADDSVRAAYADWLAERGDVRAEYLRLVQQLARIPARLKELGAQLDPAWLRAVHCRAVKARLRVLRGVVADIEYPVYEGLTYLGRSEAEPVDIDLSLLELPDRVWSSRQHAVFAWEDGALFVEDLNSSNGTFVNRARVYPGQRRRLEANDVVQVGPIQLQVLLPGHLPGAT
jgi:uncharacterized protein (TIGR02996 family)